jgi:hypothetical protein
MMFDKNRDFTNEARSDDHFMMELLSLQQHGRPNISAKRRPSDARSIAHKLFQFLNRRDPTAGKEDRN